MTGDSSTQTRNSVNDLFNTVILGFFVVVFVLMFFMGETNALFVGMSIPLSMVIAFILIPIVGFTMNMVVLMSFIMVLGIVVDNSIVVVENVYRHLHHRGLSDHRRHQAGCRRSGFGCVYRNADHHRTVSPSDLHARDPGQIHVLSCPSPSSSPCTASILVAYIMNPVFAVSFMKRPNSGQHPKKIPRPLKKSIYPTLALVALAVLFILSGTRDAGQPVTFGTDSLLCHQIYSALLCRQVPVLCAAAFSRTFIEKPWPFP